MIEKKIIRDFLTTLAGKDVPIGYDDSLLDSKMIDSLKITELIIFLESNYKVTFNNDELIPDNLDTINAIVRLLQKKGVSK